MEEVPVEPSVTVEDVEDPSVVVEALLSDGAVGLTPPRLSAVDVPPVERTLTLTVIVVTSVELDAGSCDLAEAAPGPSVVSRDG